MVNKIVLKKRPNISWAVTAALALFFVTTLAALKASAGGPPMWVSDDGWNWNKLAEKVTLHVESPYCEDGFLSHVDEAVALFPASAQEGVRRRLSSPEVLRDIRVIGGGGHGVHVVFELRPRIPWQPIGDVFKALVGEVLGPWIYPLH